MDDYKSQQMIVMDKLSFSVIQIIVGLQHLWIVYYNNMYCILVAITSMA